MSNYINLHEIMCTYEVKFFEKHKQLVQIAVFNVHIEVECSYGSVNWLIF
jgi:hypothetical protein